MPTHSSTAVASESDALTLDPASDPERAERDRSARLRDLRALDADARASKAALRTVLTLACPRHGAREHEPCWVVPSEAGFPAVCGHRIRRAGYTATPSTRSTTTRLSRRR